MYVFSIHLAFSFYFTLIFRQSDDYYHYIIFFDSSFSNEKQFEIRFGLNSLFQRMMFNMVLLNSPKNFKFCVKTPGMNFELKF
jgi:hypothetical protein